MMTAFVCANCARPGKPPAEANRTKPDIPDFGWPGRAEQVLVPCTGRLQPEHVLRAFESGSTLVAIVACSEDNCHYIEGSRRCARRVDYLRLLLKEIGLGEERLRTFSLPGSASEDMALAASQPAAVPDAELEAQIAEIREQARRALQQLPPNPLAGDLSGPIEEDSDE